MRYSILDCIRGFTVISMVFYHIIWDAVYLFGADMSWYRSAGGYIWQQITCCTFILLSGFCWSLGKKKLKRGLTVFGAGIIITLITLIFMPEQKILFGVLTLLGSCMLILIPLEKLLLKTNSTVGFSISLLLFLLLKNIDAGYLGIGSLKLFYLPKEIYKNIFTAYLGFPAPSFFSADYFPIIPWLFLFITGYFLFRIIKEKGMLFYLSKNRIPPLAFIGRHSLVIYILHQPLIYFCFNLIFTIINMNKSF